jgi:uncharacterized sulfatase
MCTWFRFAIIVVLVSGTVGRAGAQSQKPNVLVIIVDDLNNHLGCYGAAGVHTPNIDRLARRGVCFDRAYCQYPLCNPSRASFLSGRRPATTGVFGNTTSPRKNLGDVAFLPAFFRMHGYFTARHGKVMHGTFEEPAMWDVSGPIYGNGSGTPFGKPLDKADEKTQDGVSARRTVQLLEERRDKPFFIVAGFHRPHTPLEAPRRFFDMYPAVRQPLPEQPADGRKLAPRFAFKTTHPTMKDDDEIRRARAAYYACVSFVDAQIGLILDALERQKLMDNTLIVLFSDHGFHLGEHIGLWGKSTLFEESARVPLIVVAPGKQHGVHSPRLVELVDVYPTLADLCGLPAAKGVEGASFAPLLDDPQRPWKRAAFTSIQRNGGKSVRTERYRCTVWGMTPTSPAELYDHDRDPRELVNLASDPAHAAVLAEMRRLLRDGWQAALPPKK